MHLFRSVTPDLARDAFYASGIDLAMDLEKLRADTENRIKRQQAAYQGGEKALDMLIKRFGEAWTDWLGRRGHYRNVPVTRWAVNKLSWLCYGQPPTIEVWIGERPPSMLARMAAQAGGEEIEDGEDSAELSAWVQMELEENRNAAMMQKAMRQRLLLGQAVVKVWGVDADGVPAMPYVGLRMDVLGRLDAVPIYDPDDLDVLLAVAEYRKAGKQWRLWTTDSVYLVDSDLSVQSEEGEHPVPGVIPFAVLGDGAGLMDDLVDYQKVLINRHSLQWAVERAYAFPIGEMKGMPTNQETGQAGGGWPDGPRGLDVGGVRYLHFPDPNGGFSWVSPDAPVAEMRASYEAELKEAIELGAGLPAEQMTGSGGTTPEQPTTIALRWLKAFISRDNLLLEATAFEDARLHIMLEYGAQNTDEFDLPAYRVEDVDWEIEFPRNPLPHDNREERTEARAEVLADLRLEADYIREFVTPEATQEELEMMLEQLKSQKQAGGTSSNPTMPPMTFGQENEPEDEMA